MMEKRKILYIGGFKLPDKNAAAQRVIANSKLFSILGYEVTLIGLDKERNEFVFNGFRCINLKYPSSINEWYRYLFTIKNYISYLKEIKPQFVIAYNHPAIALKKLLHYNKARNVKTLSDCTEWYEPEGSWFFRIIKGWDTEKRMNDVHCKLDGVITISSYLDDFYKAKGVKTLLLPPLVDKSEDKWKNNVGECKNDVARLFFAGSTAGTKDRIDFVIEALDQLALNGFEFTMDIVGITEKQYCTTYKKEIPSSLLSYVKFHGRQKHIDVIRQLQESDFQIFLRENHLANRAGFPTKFSETISAGTIVLTNASSNLKDYMIEGVNSFELDITDVEKLVNTLKVPLSLTKEQIRDIKAKMDTSVFDYNNYIFITEIFFNSLK